MECPTLWCWETFAGIMVRKKNTLKINRGAFLFQTLIVYFCILVVVTYYVTSLSESYRIKMASNQGKNTGSVWINLVIFDFMHWIILLPFWWAILRGNSNSKAAIYSFDWNSLQILFKIPLIGIIMYISYIFVLCFRSFEAILNLITSSNCAKENLKVLNEPLLKTFQIFYTMRFMHLEKRNKRPYYDSTFMISVHPYQFPFFPFKDETQRQIHITKWNL